MHPSALPVVGIPCDAFERGLYPSHGVGEKYIDAVGHGAGVLPILLPCLEEGKDLRALSAHVDPAQVLDMLDGVFFTGSPSNVEPHHYGGAPSAPGTLHDPQRDATTLPLLRLAIARGVPLFCVCRGFQELNVALGGTLHQRVHEVSGMMDHRDNDDDPREVQYALAHDIAVEEGGVLAPLVPGLRARVNSLHWQGIERLAPGLRVEARAPDGLIEAVSVAGSPGFTLGVQWHPEWRFRENPLSVAMFAAFGQAVRARHAARAAVQVPKRGVGPVSP
jgi:putative glutamine amidotransferase